ncbi:MAG: dihydroorotate dehydrogenase electron transfer subunit [Phycisphaerae bacterium]
MVENTQLCREHLRLVLRLDSLPPARPGQFVHIRPESVASLTRASADAPGGESHDDWLAECKAPTLRRAFSIAGLRRYDDGAEVDVIYRVVGVATHRMALLRRGDRVSVIGPLGNAFPISADKSHAWLVSGGVGLPPMLWLAEALSEQNKETVAFYGAQTVDLLAVSCATNVAPLHDASRATLSAIEFASTDTPVVMSTDDGSYGYHGHVGAAMAAYHAANPTAAEELVVYTCGPELMMRFVADYCSARGIECHACLERDMACGTGLCQSCVVAVRADADPADFSYELCCREGPVFEATRVIWDPDAQP